MLAAAALDALDQEDRERVLAHVRRCRTCARDLEEYRDLAAGLALSLPHHAMDRVRSDRVRDRLLARAGRREAHWPAPQVTSAPRQRRERARLTGRWAGWSVAAVLAGVLLMHHAVHRPLNYGWLVAGGLVLVLVGLGIYASVQRGRVAALRARLGQLGEEADTDTRDQGRP